MNDTRRTFIDSAEIPVWALRQLGVRDDLVRPRVEIVFDTRSRAILGFRVAGSRPID